MLAGKSITCVIPARLGSTRLPKKMLALVQGAPLLQRTFEAARSVPCFDRVIVAVDSPELFDLVVQIGGEAIYTSPSCASGTDRLVELQKRGLLPGDVFVNWQGDEPFVTKETIGDLLQTCGREGEWVWTLKKKWIGEEGIEAPQLVKVVTDFSGKALYFSRSLIPFPREEGHPYFVHVGLYAFTPTALKRIGTLPRASIEVTEGLEQLRFLYFGIPIEVHETKLSAFGIDTKEQLEAAQNVELVVN